MIYQILLPLSVDRPFSYASSTPLESGQLVSVPFRGKEIVGVVWGNTPSDYQGDVKTITQVLPWSFPSMMLPFITWVAEYNIAPLGSVLKMALPTSSVQEKKNRTELKLPSFTDHQSLTPLSPEQHQAHQRISQSLGHFKPFLLDGVTGSGKTEVYFHVLDDVLRNHKQALILLPEIALTSQWLSRFESRFGAPPLLWHSQITESMRRKTWQAIIKGEGRVVVGARSALFLPFPDLGIIIVDEEHDPSYKQEEQILYQARDMAVKRAQLTQIPIVLASATPSLETYLNAQAGKYDHLHLHNRFGSALLPELTFIDMRAQPKKEWISPPLREAIIQTVSRGEQGIIFLNRRGYAPLTLCHDCGHRLQCPDCHTWLVEHKSKNHLLCHSCHFQMDRPKTCPECHAQESLIACGPGVERIVEDIHKKFPSLRVEVLTSDHIHNVDQLKAIVDRVTNHEVDLLVGTQILAKGYHFPLMTLVGVIDADLGLSGSDLRAGERTYQLLHQVAGRAGRDQRKGHVLLQTYNPDHPIFHALQHHDRQSFLELEASEREMHNMPPFGRLIGIVISAIKPDVASRAAEMLAKTAPHLPGIRILGPAPAPMNKLRGRFRWRFLIKADKSLKIQPVIKQWLQSTKNLGNVRVSIDVDPYTFT